MFLIVRIFYITVVINKVKSAENNCKLFCTTFLVLTIFNNLPQGSHFILVEITLESVSGTDRAQ